MPSPASIQFLTKNPYCQPAPEFRGPRLVFVHAKPAIDARKRKLSSQSNPSRHFFGVNSQNRVGSNIGFSATTACITIDKPTDRVTPRASNWRWPCFRQLSIFHTPMSVVVVFARAKMKSRSSREVSRLKKSRPSKGENEPITLFYACNCTTKDLRYVKGQHSSPPKITVYSRLREN